MKTQEENIQSLVNGNFFINNSKLHLKFLSEGVVHVKDDKLNFIFSGVYELNDEILTITLTEGLFKTDIDGKVSYTNKIDMELSSFVDNVEDIIITPN